MANMRYNGVDIHYCFTRKHGSETAYTEDRADWIGTDHSVYVEGVVYADEDNPFAGDRYVELRKKLEEPRKALLFTVNGRTVLESDADKDIANGPHPEIVAIDRVIGSEAFRISFLVKTRLEPCKRSSQAVPYLSNRWEEYETRGPEHLARLVRTGKLVVSAGFFADTQLARSIVTPPVHRNFNRVHAEYKVQSNGLALTYTFIDQQVEWNPPSPAIKIEDATYTESSPDGGSRYGEVRVSLVGPPIPNAVPGGGDLPLIPDVGGLGEFRAKVLGRRALLAAAISVAVRRLQNAGAMIPGRANTPVLMSLTEKLHQNRVSVMIRCQIPATIIATKKNRDESSLLSWGLGAVGAGVGFVIAGPVGAGILGGAGFGAGAGVAGEAPIPRLPVNLAGWGFPPAGSAAAGVPDMGLRSPTGLRLVAAVLNDPCLGRFVDDGRTADITATGAGLPLPPPPPSEPVSNIPVAQVSVVDRLPDDLPDVVAALAPPGVYTDYRITCQWEGDEHVAHMAATDSEGESVFVGYASPTKQLTIEYEAERQGAAPAIPPADLGANYVLLARSDGLPELKTGSDGITITKKRNGWMIFGVKRPAQVIAGAAVPPWVLDQLRQLARAGDGATAQAIEAMLTAASVDEVADAGILPWVGVQPPSLNRGQEEGGQDGGGNRLG